MCVCHMHMDNVVSVDTYQLDLWAGEQLLWKSAFKPSEHGEQGGAGRGSIGRGCSCSHIARARKAASIWGRGPFKQPPTPDGVVAPFWASVLPSLKWGWAQQYVRTPSVQIFQRPVFKCPDQGAE